MGFQLEFVGGAKDGQICDITSEDMTERVLTITYKSGNEIYTAKKFKGEWVLFYSGLIDDGKPKRKKK